MTGSRAEAFSRLPLLYLIAGRAAGQSWTEYEERLQKALRGGVGVLQMREKNLPAAEAFEAGIRYRRIARAAGALFVVNDDPVLARDLGADGVHVGQDDASPRAVRRIVGSEMVIGWSTHDRDQVTRASRDPDVDLIGIGPVQDTSTKDAGPAIGLETALQAAEIFERGPVFPIGGIDGVTAAALARGGLHRAAVASAILEAEDPELAAAELLAALR